jgi:hypothetical protein
MVRIDRSHSKADDMRTKKRSERARAVDAKLRTSAEQMLEGDETVTARSLARRAGLRAASSITRDAARRALLGEFQHQQERRRTWVQRAKKVSTAKLQRALAARDEQVAALTRKVQLLVASHKAMLLALDETGGTKAWARFFAGYRHSLECLHDAVPSGQLAARAAPPPPEKRP